MADYPENQAEKTASDLHGLRRTYAAAVKVLKGTESELNRALDALAAARAAEFPSDVARTRKVAVDAERAAGIAWDEAEVARRAFWRHRAAELEQKIVSECVPLLVQLAAYQRFAGLPPIPIEHVLRHHLAAPQGHAEPAGEVGIDPLPAPALERADDEILAWQPPLRRNFDRSGRRLKQ